jgi:hypothetical protein
MLSLSISYWDLIKFHYFADTTERGEGDEREDEDMVTLGFKLWSAKSGSKLYKAKVGPISTLQGKFAQWNM